MLFRSQKVSLLKTLTTEDRRDIRELDTGLARLAGIPTIPGMPVVLDPKGEEFKRLQTLRADAQQLQSEATRDGKVLTPRQTLLQLEQRIEQRRNTTEARAAQEKIKTFAVRPDGTPVTGRAWMNGPLTKENIPALRRLAGNDINKNRQVDELEKLLKKAEGDE